MKNRGPMTQLRKEQQQQQQQQHSQVWVWSIFGVKKNGVPTRKLGGKTSWWLQIWVIFILSWRNDPIWLICLKWVETTNHKSMIKKMAGADFCSESFVAKNHQLDMPFKATLVTPGKLWQMEELAKRREDNLLRGYPKIAGHPKMTINSDQLHVSERNFGRQNPTKWFCHIIFWITWLLCSKSGETRHLVVKMICWSKSMTVGTLENLLLSLFQVTLTSSTFFIHGRYGIPVFVWKIALQATKKNRDTPSGITPWFLRKGLVHPDKFISTTPHMTFAHGEEQIAWLKKRASKKHACWLRVDFWGFTVRGIHNPPVLVMFFLGDMNI